MSSNQGVENPNSPSTRQQTTSTPNDDKKSKTAILPASTDFSFMNASRDDPQIDSFALNQKVPNLSSLLNGTNTSKVSSNLSNNQSAVSDGPQSSSGEIVVRMSRLVINNDAIDDQLRVRENYLNRLKSIDLSKYSFPNEYKI